MRADTPGRRWAGAAASGPSGAVSSVPGAGDPSRPAPRPSLPSRAPFPPVPLNAVPIKHSDSRFRPAPGHSARCVGCTPGANATGSHRAWSHHSFRSPTRGVSAVGNNHYSDAMVDNDRVSANEDMIGREEVDDLEAILAIANTDVDEAIHTVADNADAIFTWDYEKGARPALNKLYEKAKASQWNGETDLPWDTEVDVERLASEMGGNPVVQRFRESARAPGSPFEHFGDREWNELVIEGQNWRLSQFMHGEQGALLCTAKIVETVPWIDAKYYASTQVMDEARHVEVFAKYLD